MTDINKLSQMSGDKESKTSPKLELNQIKLNGAKGNFVLENVKNGLKETPDGKKTYEKEVIPTNSIEIVFLKTRKKLVQFRKGQKNLSTTEFNHNGQRVVLYGGDKTETGIASELREKYPQLRTHQIVYAIYGTELVRVFFKGASLGSQNKDKNTTDFYSYVSSFKNDEHIFQYKTILNITEEKGDLGSYYVISFEKGRKLTDGEMETVEQEMTTVFDFCKESDEYQSQFFKDDKVSSVKELDVIQLDEEETYDYPNGEANPDEIPF